MQIDLSKIVDQGLGLAMNYIPMVALAILTLIIGNKVIKWLVARIGRIMDRTETDESLSKFLMSLLGIGLKIMLILSVAAMFGINTTAFIAIFSALMVGVGMALNGTIGHFASGVMLLIFKPFKVGDLVTIGVGRTGTVEAINAFNTTLKTLDNQRIIIGNSNVTGNDVINISGQEIVGVELDYGIGYDDDIDRAKKIILEVGEACPYILKDPSQGVVVSSLGDSAVVLSTRPFCKSEHFWDTKFYMQEHVKKAFDKQDIGIPYNTLDIKMINN